MDGLYDAQGRKLVRARPPMGFDLNPKQEDHFART
jgi:hypothetical protein